MVHDSWLKHILANIQASAWHNSRSIIYNFFFTQMEYPDYKTSSKDKKSETWGNRIESHVKKAWTMWKALTQMRETWTRACDEEKQEMWKQSSLASMPNIFSQSRETYSYLRSQKWELSYVNEEDLCFLFLKSLTEPLLGSLFSSWSIIPKSVLHP